MRKKIRIYKQDHDGNSSNTSYWPEFPVTEREHDAIEIAGKRKTRDPDTDYFPRHPPGGEKEHACRPPPALVKRIVGCSLQATSGLGGEDVS
jgi:hypothetical protein